jgi:hypothetical protein
MPEERGLYLRMPVVDQLMFFGSLYGMTRREARRVALDWLARFRIAEMAERRAESLSKGNQQKVQFIATVLHDPDVLLMDEPFVGLDPINVALLKDAFLELRDRGKTLVFSTHQSRGRELAIRAIIDRRRLAGPLRDVTPSGRRAPTSGSRPATRTGWPRFGPGLPMDEVQLALIRRPDDVLGRIDAAAVRAAWPRACRAATIERRAAAGDETSSPVGRSRGSRGRDRRGGGR